VPPTDSLLSSVQLDVEVEAPGTLRVSNNVADVTGSAELVLRGNLAEPVLYGEIGVDPGGTMIYNSTDYRIERGRLIFADPYELDPEVDLVATTRVRDFDVTLALSGTFDRLETRFSSEPPLPDLEVFRLLSTGDQTPRETDLTPRLAELDDDRSTSAATFLYGQAASVIGERVTNLFGFDKFRIDPLTGSGDNLSKARVTVGKRLSKDVFVTYSVDPASTEEQRLQLEWQVSPGFWVVLNQNGDNSYSADARWERSF
jgi:translocation and assembly module TamB